jgi:hypothetical protein
MIIDRRHGPSRGLRGGSREAAEKSGDPEADAAFIGSRRAVKKHEKGKNCGGKSPNERSAGFFAVILCVMGMSSRMESQCIAARFHVSAQGRKHLRFVSVCCSKVTRYAHEQV